MANRLLSWLRFFRIVNLPTVPGDVMVGAAAVFYTLGGGSLSPVVYAELASCGVYLYGLADNDIVGAKTDVDRPIPRGEISLTAARVARGLCWGMALVCGVLGHLPSVWWVMMLGLFGAIVVYNRTKNAWLMGACRGFNLMTGAAAVFCCPSAACWRTWLFPGVLAVLWTLYIGWVTRYSEGEDRDDHKRATVGLLIGALVYLQLVSLVLFTLHAPRVPVFRPMLLTGAVLLVCLRLLRSCFPKVSAS